MIVDESNPPPVSVLHMMGRYWERSLDPAHPNAFPKELNIAQSTDPRKEGWMMIDGIENPVGFVSDGQEYEGPDTCNDYDFRIGPATHKCAYQKGDYNEIIFL